MKDSQSNLSNIYELPVNLSLLNRTGIDTQKTSGMDSSKSQINQQVFSQATFANKSINYHN